MILRLSDTAVFALKTAAGTCLCAALAVVLALIFSTNPHKSWLPILFIAILLFIALRFGAVSGLAGGVAATLIFAYFLFTPVGSVRVEKKEARDNLGWMLLVGVPVSYFAAHMRDRNPAKP